MVVSALLGGLGAIGGTYLSAGIQKSANKDMLNRQMAFNAQQAQIGRQFQERMIRNAHQYEVEDLRKANLNPILSANGGASGASGASASVSGNGSINVDNPFTSWVNSKPALMLPSVKPIVLPFPITLAEIPRGNCIGSPFCGLGSAEVK